MTAFNKMLKEGKIDSEYIYILSDDEVKKLLQNDFQDTMAKYQIIKSARLYRQELAIAALNTGTTRVLAAQAADDLLNISGIAKGITIENAKYLLDNAEITCEYQFGVSNEVLRGKVAKITVKEGKLLLIKDRA